MTATQRAAQVFMVIFGLLTIVFYSSVYAAAGDDAFPDDANALIATGGAALDDLAVSRPHGRVKFGSGQSTILGVTLVALAPQRNKHRT